MAEQTEQDERVHPRADLSITVRATFAPGHAVTGIVRDVSWGGVSFSSSYTIFERGDRLVVAFPWHRGDSFALDAEVVRSVLTTDGRLTVAARFTSVPLASHRKLTRLLQLMHRQRARDRSPVRLTKTLEICADGSAFRELLGQIASGEVLTVTSDILPLDQSIELKIAHASHRRALSLRARVVDQDPIVSQTADAARSRATRLRLEHPTEELEIVARKLSKRLAAMGTGG